ncbi:hypothetical protein [Nocardia testacea]|uniref:hypothetical protein n=1 Tax=Nocardia testacea TaxID=248551 RepID=UPI00031E8434|nr:hypothetical protein [Nocardia testacea]
MNRRSVIGTGAAVPGDAALGAGAPSISACAESAGAGLPSAGEIDADPNTPAHPFPLADAATTMSAIVDPSTGTTSSTAMNRTGRSAYGTENAIDHRKVAAPATTEISMLPAA